ncbi:EAL domain-containing protein [Paenibacillus sp. FSL R10-2734]|uniref:bifunctional diguanylate cyclase/phosphodiesterase n=1 Tax=Paenibacillus sp. FSL R10-2734 TaxID=2954691 RepID=UPI0030D85614
MDQTQLRIWRMIGLAIMAMLIFSGCSYYFIKWTFGSYFGSYKEEAATATSEATIHASKSIGNMIQSGSDYLDGIADSISEIDDMNWEEAPKYLHHFDTKYNFIRISIISPDGKAYASDGEMFEVSDEVEFQKALQGISSISDPFLDKISNKEIITINSPLKFRGKVKGAISASRYTQDLYEALGATFFNGHGYSQIIDHKGQVIVKSKYHEADKSIDNIFESISLDSRNKKQLKIFRENISTNKSEIGIFWINGESTMVGYSGIQGIEDWYILSVMPQDVIIVRATEMSHAAFLFCIIMFVLLLIIFANILWNKRKTRKNMDRITFEDELTHLSRANLFVIDAQHLLKEYPNTRFAVMQFDIEQFNYINEIVGFPEGNSILIQVANCLTENALAEDVIGRLGGDRFILFTSYESKSELLIRMQVLTEEMSDCTFGNEEGFRIVINCGIYCVEDNQSDILACIDRAGIACKSIKGGYKSACMFFDEQLLLQMHEEQDIVRKMGPAMTNGEFIVYLQPKIDLRVNRFHGAEALVRWNDPQKGLISPVVFIPIFERNRFIVKLDLMVLESVCIMLSKWIQEGIQPLPISVNISLVTLYHNEFLINLTNIINRYEVPARLIELELTESIVFQNLEFVRDILLDLKSKGFSIAIDDFGTGYSSLNVLQFFPADVIKLDRAFLMSKSNDETGKIVIASMVKLAKDLNMKVVAEGVETEEQIDFLKQVDCEIAQGYYFAKPMPVEEYEILIKST